MYRIKILSSTITIALVVFFSLNLMNTKKEVHLQVFSDISSKIKFVPDAKYFGLRAFQLDFDDEFEYILSGFGVPNVILDNVGFSLGRKEIKNLEDPYGKTVSITACDVDGDGMNELYAINDFFDSPQGVSKNRLYKLKDNYWIDLLLAQDNAGRNAVGRCV